MLTQRVTRAAVGAGMVALCLPVAASAQVVVRAGSGEPVTVGAGEVVAVPVRVELSGGVGVATLEATVTWRVARATFEGIDTVPGLGWTPTVNTTQASSGSVTFNVYGANNLPTSGPVAYLRFRGQSGGGTPLTLSPRIVADAAGESVLPAVTPSAGAMCVAQAIRWGEVSGDGAVNVIDAQQIARFSVGLSVSQPTLLAQAGDVTADGNVNVLDAQQIARFSVGLSASARTNTVVYSPPAAASVQLAQAATQDLVVGETLTLGAEPLAADGTGLLGCQAVQWSSSDPAVATVTSDGTVTGITAGTATISVSVGGTTQAATTTLTVSAAVVPTRIGRTMVVGRNHTCALDEQGKAYCWGFNRHGQIGDGTLDDKLEPTPVATDVRFVSLAAGQLHTCGLSAAGDAYCWGGNRDGQLGDGTNTDRLLPVRVATTVLFTQLHFSANSATSCAITVAGRAYCWGRSTDGQIGDGTTTSRYIPTPVMDNGVRFSLIDSNLYHSCALTTAGEAYCWGRNSYGQIGDGTTNASAHPIKVSGSTLWKFITVGLTFTCAISADDLPYCWGNNWGGQLGDGSTSTRNVPTRVATATTVSAIGAGNSHACGLLSTGTVQCWGDLREQPPNWYTGLGDGSTVASNVPVNVRLPEGAQVVDLQVGNWHTCLLDEEGAVSCWGYSYWGALGQEYRNPSNPTPQSAEGLTATTHVAVGASSSCAVAGGESVCWGGNFLGILGDGSSIPRYSPGPVASPTSLRAVVLGQNHGCGLSAEGNAYCWGANRNGQLGDQTTTDRASPVSVSSSHAYIFLVAGGSHTCGLTVDRSAYCWGLNSAGQLGDGSLMSQTTPAPVHTSIRFVELSAGQDFTCGLSESSAVYCWGANTYGQLGTGNTGAWAQPKEISSGIRFKHLISPGSKPYYTMCAIAESDEGYCWGRNNSGAIGNGSLGDQTSPAKVAASLRFQRIASGQSSSCGIDISDRLWCWGGNATGEVGDGTRDQRLTPVQIDGNETYQSVSVGNLYACGVTTGNAVRCWGNNSGAQLGSMPSIAVPNPIVGNLKVWVP